MNRVWSVSIRFLVVAMISMVVTGCGGTEKPQVEVNPNSGGLGLTHDEWSAAHGKPETTKNETVIFGDNNLLDVYHMDFGKEGDYQPILFTLKFSNLVDLEAAKGAVMDYIPTDATIVDEYSRSDSDSIVVLYHSDWLADTMSGDPWLDAEPGSFLAIYYGQGDQEPTGIVSVLIGTSHSP